MTCCVRMRTSISSGLMLKKRSRDSCGCRGRYGKHAKTHCRTGPRSPPTTIAAPVSVYRSPVCLSLLDTDMEDLHPGRLLCQDDRDKRSRRVGGQHNQEGKMNHVGCEQTLFASD